MDDMATTVKTYKKVSKS